MIVLIKGSTTSGGGGGGRISITYMETEFTGAYVAYGGRSSHSTGGAGTVYVDANGKTKLYVDNKESSNVEVCLSFQIINLLKTCIPLYTFCKTLQKIFQ